jgi:hypothetical protein
MPRIAASCRTLVLILSQFSERRPGKYRLSFRFAMIPSRPRSRAAWKNSVPLSAPDNRHTSNGGVLERIAKGVTTDHFQLRQRLQTASVQPSERLSTTSRCCKGRHQSCLVVAIMTVRAPPASRRRDSAPQTARSRLSSRTCRGSEAKRASSVAFHRRL